MFGIVALGNMRYIGNGEEGVRSGRGSRNKPAGRIFAPVKKCSEVVDGGEFQLQREKTLSIKFGHPEYITERNLN